MKIIIEEYNPKWKEQFESLRSYLLPHLSDHITKIVHVGSTSLPGMNAKPIIDIDIIIENNKATLKKVIDKLEILGYNYVGDQGISGREAFKRPNSKTPVTASNKDWFKHHLYVCNKDSIALRNHLALKKHLTENPIKAAEYSNLKKHLAHKFTDDM